MEPDASSLPALPPLLLLLPQNQSFNFQAPGSWLSNLSTWRGWSHWEELRVLNKANTLNNESQELPPAPSLPGPSSQMCGRMHTCIHIRHRLTLNKYFLHFYRALAA